MKNIKLNNKLIEFLKKIIRNRKSCTALCDTIKNKYGWLNSLKKGFPQDNDSNILPWYTYPFIEFINRLDFKNKKIFEWGSGYSSIFWANRAFAVTSIENDKEWFEKIDKIKKDNNKIILAESEKEYVNNISDEGGKYDVIIIDGKHRPECAKIAPDHLNSGGMIILDNSDWFPKTREILTKNNFVEINFCGFGPLNSYAWATSIFIKADFTFPNEKLEVVGGIIATDD